MYSIQETTQILLLLSIALQLVTLINLISASAKKYIEERRMNKLIQSIIEELKTQPLPHLTNTEGEVKSEQDTNKK